MRLAMVGLGKMGLNMTRRLLRGGHEVVAYNRSPDPVRQAEEEGAAPASSISDLVKQLEPPRVVWVMVPAGDPTASVIDELRDLLDEDDVVVDGGNSKWKETVERAVSLRESGIRLLDAGTSGGVWGLEIGYCLMVGGEESAFEMVEPALVTLAPENGYLHVGPSGAGHFVKMIHNGIEYGIMQSYGEGFDILHNSEYDLDLPSIAGLWNNGSVIRSWLLELAERALQDDPNLEAVAAFVEDSGEGRWSVQAAIHESVPAPALSAALFARFYSRTGDSFSAKLIAALRDQFGGHGTGKPEGS